MCSEECQLPGAVTTTVDFSRVHLRPLETAVKPPKMLHTMRDHDVQSPHVVEAVLVSVNPIGRPTTLVTPDERATVMGMPIANGSEEVQCFHLAFSQSACTVVTSLMHLIFP